MRASTTVLTWLCLAALTMAPLTMAACSEKKAKVDPGPDGDMTMGDMPADVPGDMPTDGDMDMDMDIIPDGPKKSTNNHLLWKRGIALSNDLIRALDLEPDQVCKELGQFDCIGVHIIALGGNEPFALGLYEPVAEPMVTTPAAIDRMVLGGCSQRVEADIATGAPVVFTTLDLTLTAVDVGDPAIATAVDAEITNLYRRFHSRDPQPDELEIARQLTTDAAGGAVSAADFAKMACFAIGTTTEFVLY